MNRTALVPGVLLAGALVTALWWGTREENSGDTPFTSYEIQTQRFEQWLPLRGQVIPREPVILRAERNGLSKLVWIIGDGTPVDAGEVVARFDPSELEEKSIQLSRDLRMARADLRALRDARHPLEMERLKREQAAAKEEAAAAKRLLEETRELEQENLIPQREVERQRDHAETAQSVVTSLERQLMLTETVLHPAIEQKADARVNAAEAALKRIKENLEATTVRAPVQGTVSLPPVPMENGRRPVRVGDGLYRNQVFMEIADLTRLVVRTGIGERYLSSVLPGQPARVMLPALPDTVLEATVRSVGTRPTGPDATYPVDLDLRELPNETRPGLTADIDVLTYHEDGARVLPRAFAGAARGNTVQVNVRENGGWTTREVDIGPGNATGWVVRKGLTEGDQVRTP